MPPFPPGGVEGSALLPGRLPSRNRFRVVESRLQKTASPAGLLAAGVGQNVLQHSPSISPLALAGSCAEPLTVASGCIFSVPVHCGNQMMTGDGSEFL